ncbi:polyamine-transporting ATPase 13A3-like [Heterodontus francisci]|uniref:polyamine-transporting ATPase 13A3-like n=1 Tax=Heterodontus francisci TaxID=7792 RepID=UPI00355BBB58
MSKNRRTNPAQRTKQQNTAKIAAVGNARDNQSPAPKAAPADGSKGPPQAQSPGEEPTQPSGTDQHSLTDLLTDHDEPQKKSLVGSGDAATRTSVHYRVVNVGEGNEMVIYGYCWSWWRAVLSTLVTILSCGLFMMAFYWRPEWHMKCFCYPCHLQDAEYVLMKTTDEFQEWHRQKVKFMYLKYSPQTDRRDRETIEDVDEFSLLRKNISFTGIQIRYLQHQSIRYIWDPNKRSFVVLRGLEQNVSCSDLHKKYLDGLVYQESQNRKLIYGPNIIAVQVPPYWKLLGKEILNPFYAFQAFSVILWFVEAYYPYAVAIIVMSICSIALSLYTARKQYTMLHEMVQSHNSIRVTVLRKGSASEIVSSSELVPGDVIIIPQKEMILPCDVVLMNGAVVVNESMLTGESVPVTKTPLPDICEAGHYNDPIFRLEDYKRHVLFCGTLIIQVRPYEYYVKAVVIRTGFLTTKGQLVRSILFPKPVDFKLFRDARRFVICLVMAAILGFVYTIIISSIRGEPIPEILLKAFDVITIVVPPALPAAVTVGVVYAQRRLKRRGIYCISPHRINLCGQLDLVCFDKTGTLTENGMDLFGVVRAKNKNFIYSNEDLKMQVFNEDEVLAAMATCHSLTLASSATTLQGDPLDLTIFRATNWNIPLSGAEPTQHKPRIHFVIDGPSLSVIEDKFPELLPKVTLYGTVFARMSPDMKTKLIKSLQSLDYVVGMCGDGANDCGALKTAHVGISLSQLEASVASPFTSKLPTIECVPILIKEGRAALVTSFCAFKYMALYSTIQYVSVLILYYISSNLGNWEFLYEDLFITSAIAITMSRNKAYEHLVPQRPNANLVSPQLLLSVLMHIALCSTFQLMGFLLVQIQPWYNPWDQGARACTSNHTFYGMPAPHSRNNSGILFNMQWKISNYVNTTVFFVSVFQYITIAFVFSMGKPFRKPISTNYLFLAVLVVLYLFTLFLMLFPSSSLDTFFEFVCIPYIWRIYILLMVVGHFVLSVFLEEVLTNNHRLWNWLSRMYCPSASLVKHKKLHQELQDDPSWPPVTTPTSHKGTVQ